MKSSNFVLGGLTRGAAQRSATAPYGTAPGYGQPGYGQPGYGQPGYGDPTQPGYPPAAPPRTDEAMTVDDVVVRTVGLLAIVGVVGALSWLFLPPAIMPVALLGSGITGLLLVLVISFGRIFNPYLIGACAIAEGVLVGVASKMYEALFSGIVVQAAVATFAVFAGMALLYKSRVIRVSSGFVKVMSGIGFGVIALIVVNLGFSLFGMDLGIFGDPTDGKFEWLPVLVTLGLIVWGALTFLIDFKMVEDGVRMGAPRKFAWLAAFGMMIGLVFMYLQLLRLLALLRE